MGKFSGLFNGADQQNRQSILEFLPAIQRTSQSGTQVWKMWYQGILPVG